MRDGPSGPGGFGEGEVAGPKYPHKDLGLTDLALLRIHDGHRLAGVVHENLLSGLVLLAQNRIEAVPPLAEEIAEAAVLVAIGVNCLVLEPQELERDRFAAELGVDVLPVGNRTRMDTGYREADELETAEPPGRSR